MSNNIKYWKGEDELTKNPSFLAAQRNEFHDDLPLDEVFNEEGVNFNHIIGSLNGFISKELKNMIGKRNSKAKIHISKFVR